MTVAVVVLYVVSAVLELAGVCVVIAEARDRRRRRGEWDDSVDAEAVRMATDLRYRTDPFVSRYGVSPEEIRRASAGLDDLLAFRPGRDRLTVALLVCGVLTGLAANLVSALK